MTLKKASQLMQNIANNSQNHESIRCNGNRVIFTHDDIPQAIAFLKNNHSYEVRLGRITKTQIKHAVASVFMPQYA